MNTPGGGASASDSTHSQFVAWNFPFLGFPIKPGSVEESREAQEPLGLVHNCILTDD